MPTADGHCLLHHASTVLHISSCQQQPASSYEHFAYSITQAIKDYKADKKRFEGLLPPNVVDDVEVLSQELQVSTRTFCTEFEFKAGRHAARGRKKKAFILQRVDEFSNHTSKDWKVEAHPAMVALFEKILSGQGQ